MKFEKHQIEGAEFLLSSIKKRNSAFLADDMGSGKTATAIFLAVEKLKARKILVVAPASARGIWGGEFRKFSHLITDLPIVETTINTGKKQYPILYKSDLLVKKDEAIHVVVISYQLTWRVEVLRQLLFSNKVQPFDLVVYDESHLMGNSKSNISSACLVNLFEFKCPKLFVSGSVTQNKPHNFYPVLKKCLPDKFESYAKFVEEFCSVKSPKNAPWKKTITGSKNLNELFNRTTDFLIRRTKEEVLPHLPKKRERVVELEIADKIKSDNALLGKKLTPDQIVVMIQKRIHEDPDGNTISDRDRKLLAQARSTLSKYKIPAVIEYLAEWHKEVLSNKQFELSKTAKDYNREPFVLFCYHPDSMNQIRDGILKHPYLSTIFKPEDITTVSGKTKKEIRDQNVKSFQNGTTHVFLATYASAEGVTLTRANHLFIAELSWTMSKVEQALDRVHRMGQTKVVQIEYLQTDTSLDSIMYNVFRRNQDNKKKMLGEKK